ncbi:MAG: hypothetical protein AB7S26_36430 [Sandaracinaceae bacterium]
MTFGYPTMKVVADELGLRIDPPEQPLFGGVHTLHGELGGVRVYVRQWQGQFAHLELTAYLDPPADMRLSIEPAGVIARLGHALGRRGIEVGDPRIDGAFDVRADEPERARALLDPQVCAALLAFKRANTRFHVSDEAIFFAPIQGAYSSPSREELTHDIRAIVRLASAIHDAMRHVPSSTMLATYIDAWRAHAHAHDLQFSATPLRVWGMVEGTWVGARATAAEGGYGVDVRLRFTPRLPFDLHVRPVRFFDFLPRAGGAVHTKTGDAAFDREFCVTTTQEARARAFLDARIRGVLETLRREHGDVVLSQDGLSVRASSMTDPTMFTRVAERAVSMARVLHDQAGPYR